MEKMENEQLRDLFCLFNDRNFLEELAFRKSKKSKSLPLLLTLLALSTPLQAGTYAVTSTADQPISLSAKDGYTGTLRSAIIMANNDPTPSTIILPSGSTIKLQGPLPIITAPSLIIKGSNNTPTIIDGQKFPRAFSTSNSTPNLVLENITLTNFAATGSVGGNSIGGGGGGGGSPGLGGANYVAPGTILNLTGVTIGGNIVTGGAGGTSTFPALTESGGGGGGAGPNGRGGNSTSTGSIFGGGGGGGGGTPTSGPFQGGDATGAGGGGGASNSGAGTSSSTTSGGAGAIGTSGSGGAGGVPAGPINGGNGSGTSGGGGGALSNGTSVPINTPGLGGNAVASTTPNQSGAGGGGASTSTGIIGTQPNGGSSNTGTLFSGGGGGGGRNGLSTAVGNGGSAGAFSGGGGGAAGGSITTAGVGGTGGFGAGGGGQGTNSSLSAHASGGYAGGQGGSGTASGGGGGGGGGALGGGIFIDGGLGTNGAIVNSTDVNYSGDNTLTPGAGGLGSGGNGSAGSPFGNDIFITTGGTLNIIFLNNNSQVFNLDGDNNTRSGGVANPTSGGIFTNISPSSPYTVAYLNLTNNSANYLCPLNIGSNVNLVISAEGTLGAPTNSLNLANNSLVNLEGANITFGAGRTFNISGTTTFSLGSTIVIHSLIQDGTSPGTIVFNEGEYTLTNTNTYTGGTQLIDGFVTVSSDANLGAITAPFTFNATGFIAADLFFTPASYTSARPYNFLGNGLISPGTTNLTLTGPITGNGKFILEPGSGGTFTITANPATTFGGTVVLTNEHVFMSGINPLGVGTIQTNGNDNLTLTAATTLPNPIALINSLNLNTTAGASVMTGSITGNGDLFYTGTVGSTLTISPTTTSTAFTGIFDFLQGDLSVSGINPLGVGDLELSGGTTLNLIGTDALLGNATVGLDNVVINVNAGTFSEFAGLVSGGSTPGPNFNGPGIVRFINQHNDLFTNFFLNDGITIQTFANNPPTTIPIGALGYATQVFQGPATVEFLSPGTTYSGTLINPFTFSAPGGVLVADTETTTTLTGPFQGSSGYAVGRTTDNQTGTIILANNPSVITGPIQINSGTLSVVGPTYLSSTVTPSPITLNGGTLQVTGTNTSPGFSNNIIVNPSRSTLPYGGVLSLNAGTTNLWNGTITGAPLAVQGGGTLILTQTGNTGGYYINGSTVEAASPAILGSGDIHFLNQGTLDLTGAAAVYPNNLFMDIGGGIIEQTSSGNSLTGPISGVGSLTYPGAGTLIINQNNSYQGGTFVNGGLIQVCGTSPLGTGTITFNGGNLEVTCSSTLPNSLMFNSSPIITIDSGTSSTFTGNLSGPGGWTKAGNGALTLIGNGNYLGTTNLNAGLVRVSGTNPFGIGMLNISNGSLEFIGNTALGNSSTFISASTTLTTDPGVTANINSSISGAAAAGITKNGTGTLIYSGNNTYAGPTLVTQGTLQINGTLSNSLTQVSVGATLSGTGTTNSLDIFGTLAPGNPTGTLTASGNVALEDGSTFQATINGPNFSALQVNGSTTIGTGTTLSATINSITQGAYTIINSTGPIAGVFTTVPRSDGSIRFPLTVTYTPNTVVLNFSQVPFANLVPKGNLQNIAACFDQLILNPTADLQVDLNVLNGLNLPEMSAAFNQLDPSLYNALILGEQYAAQTTRFIFSRHSYDRQFDPQFLGGIWTNIFAGRVNQENVGGGQALSGYHDNVYGALMGVDAWVGKALVSGGGSYARSQLRWTDANHALASLDSFTGFVGLTTFANPVIFDLYGSYTYNDVTGSRDIYVAPSTTLSPLTTVTTPINKHIIYKNQSSLFTGHMGLLSTIPIPNTHLFTLAFGNFDYLFVSQHPFTETGAGSLNMAIHAQTSDLFQPEIGTGIGFYTSFKGEGNILVDFRISLVKEFRFSGQSLNANFVGSSCNFFVDGLFQNNGLICPSLHILVNGVSGFDLSFDIRGAYWGRYAETTGKMEFLYVF